MNQRVLNKLSKERSISGNEWSTTHRVLKSHRSKMDVINNVRSPVITTVALYIYLYIKNIIHKFKGNCCYITL